jgi:tetratricopeptide (TPR) repeat protein
MGVADAPNENTPAGNAPAPLVLIPVSAEDVARRKRRIVLSCVAAGLVAAGIAGWLYKRSVDPLHAKESYDAGVRLLEIARYNQAILSFDRTIALEPAFADGYLMRGRAYAGEARTDQAIADFTQAIRLAPQDTRPLLDRAAAYLDLKDFQNAVRDAGRAIEINAKLAEAYNLRGTAVRSLGDPRKALADFTRAVELNPNADNYFQRGATYQMLADHKNAVADFDHVIAMKPDEAPAYFARSESRRALGDLKGAQADHLQGRVIDGR